MKKVVLLAILPILLFSVFAVSSEELNPDQKKVMKLYKKAEKNRNRSLKYAKLRSDSFALNFIPGYGYYHQTKQIQAKGFSPLKRTMARNSAITQYEELIPLSEKAFGSESPKTALFLFNLATLYEQNALNAPKAEKLYLKSLEIRKKSLGSSDPLVAESYNQLGMYYLNRLQYSNAEPFLEKSLEIREKVFGKNHPEVAYSLSGLGDLFQAIGDLNQAGQYHNRALQVRQGALKSKDPAIADSFDKLGSFHYALGDYDKALEFFKKAHKIRKKAFGIMHPLTVTSLSHLGLCYLRTGECGKARKFMTKAFRNEQTNTGSGGTGFITYFSGTLYKGSQSVSEKKLSRMSLSILKAEADWMALSMAVGCWRKSHFSSLRKFMAFVNNLEKVLGSNHPIMAQFLVVGGHIQMRKGNSDEAVKLADRAINISMTNTVDTFSIANERLKLINLSKNQWYLDILLSSLLGEKDKPANASLGLKWAMRFKGIVLEVMIGEKEAIKKGLNPELKQAYEELKGVRQEIADLYVSGFTGDSEVYLKKMGALELRKEELEAQLSKGSADFRENRDRLYVKPEDVCANMPAGAALVEYVEFINYAGEDDNKTPWMAAFVLDKNQCSNPVMVDLGPVKPIEEAVGEWREELQTFLNRGISESEARRTLNDKGKVLTELIWAPVSKALESSSKLYISPDGPLHLMTFGALPSGNDGYLIEKYDVAYVSSGKDFLKKQISTKRHGALLVGGVDFNRGQEPQLKVADTKSSTRGKCGKLNELQWNELAGTELEADAIGKAFSNNRIGASVLKGKRANEALVRKGMEKAQYIHLATHGFFLGDECEMGEAARGIGGVRPAGYDPGKEILGGSQMVRKENPLLLSGLALAGANTAWKDGGGGGGDDGYLLAMEVANLDLEGAKLVVLSACQTGLGEIKRGEGVFGLKRSFILAGAESLVMSLWNVPDEETKDLMVDFYNGFLSGGKDKRQALRDAQLKILKSGPGGSYRHPYYWAAFQYIGVN